MTWVLVPRRTLISWSRGSRAFRDITSKSWAFYRLNQRIGPCKTNKHLTVISQWEQNFTLQKNLISVISASWKLWRNYCLRRENTLPFESANYSRTGSTAALPKASKVRNAMPWVKHVVEVCAIFKHPLFSSGSDQCQWSRAISFLTSERRITDANDL